MQQTPAELPRAAARTEQWHRLLHPGKRLFGVLELLKRHLACALAQTPHVRPSVIPDPVPFPARSTSKLQAGGRAHLPPQHEEGGFDAMLPQAIEHQRCSLRFRTVIECKCDLRQPLPLGHKYDIDDVAEFFVRKQPALLDAFILDAFQHLADSLIVSIGDPELFKIVGDR